MPLTARNEVFLHSRAGKVAPVLGDRARFVGKVGSHFWGPCLVLPGKAGVLPHSWGRRAREGSPPQKTYPAKTPTKRRAPVVRSVMR